MNVLVKDSSPGHATVEIDLGMDPSSVSRHTLVVRVSSDTDNYGRVTVDWIAPAKVTGKPSQTRDRRKTRLVRALLDKGEAKVVDWRTRTYGRDRGRVVA